MAGTLQFPVTDPFLAKYGAMIPPGNTLEIHPQYGNIDLLTPYCRFSFVHFAKPRPGRKNDDGSLSQESVQALLMFHPDGIEEIEQAIIQIAQNNFSSEKRYDRVWTPRELLYAPPGMSDVIANPLRDGTDYWQRSSKPDLYENQRGLYTLNVTKPTRSKDGKPTPPVYIDKNANPCPPDTFYSGCYGRAFIRLSPYPLRGRPNQGKRGITAYLQEVQFVEHGEPLGDYDALGAAQARFSNAGTIEFDPATVAPAPQQPQQQPGFTPAPAQNYQPAAQPARVQQQTVYQSVPQPQPIPPQQPPEQTVYRSGSVGPRFARQTG